MHELIHLKDMVQKLRMYFLKIVDNRDLRPKLQKWQIFE